jgi:uncharacterized damage-inducible protein DinB
MRQASQDDWVRAVACIASPARKVPRTFRTGEPSYLVASSTPGSQPGCLHRLERRGGGRVDGLADHRQKVSSIPHAAATIRRTIIWLGGKLPMREPRDAVRDHLVRVLEWEEAHVGFDKAVAGLPPQARGVRPPGFDHSLWELLEHTRIAQDDILDFCVNSKYHHNLKWPEDYWPAAPAPPDDQAWSASIAGYEKARARLQQLVRDIEDLTATVPTGTGGQTYLRALLLTADHTAYHVGQMVAVRRALGVWP